MLELAILNHGWDEDIDWEDRLGKAAEAAIQATPHAGLLFAAIEIAIQLDSDEAVCLLNRDYRGKDKATNVLSFSMTPPDELAEAMEPHLGDIILAKGVCAREAAEKGVAMADHATHLVVHGVLHLLGYDHIEDGEADEMETLERRIMDGLGLHDPYQD